MMIAASGTTSSDSPLNHSASTVPAITASHAGFRHFRGAWWPRWNMVKAVTANDAYVVGNTMRWKSSRAGNATIGTRGRARRRSTSNQTAANHRKYTVAIQAGGGAS